MRVTIADIGLSKGFGLLTGTRLGTGGLRLALGVGLLAAVGAACGAAYEDYRAMGSDVIDDAIVGESVLVPRPAAPAAGGALSEALVDDGMHAGTVMSPGFPVSEPCTTGCPERHPGVLAALYGNHAAKVAARDAAGLPRHSTKGLVNRVFGPADHRWTAQVDALFLWQEPLYGRVLFTDAAGAPAYNVDQLPANAGIGPRAALMLHTDCTHAVEANYFSVGGLGGTGVLPATADGSTYVMNDLVGYNFADVGDAEVATTGAIQSFELNWRRWNTGAITWLVGFRWVEWNENLSIIDSYVPVDPDEPGGTDVFGIQTRNDLYGAQIGSDVLLWNAHKLVKFNAVVKAGVFYNASALQQTAVFSDRVPFDPVAVSATADQTAFFGELGINGSLKLTEWLWWRAGYNFFWLAGVAVPAKQLSVTNPGETPPTTGINTDGSVLLHGVNTGLEARW